MAWVTGLVVLSHAPLGAPFVDVVWLVLAITVAVGVLGVLLKTVSAVVTLSQDAVWSLFNPSDEATSDARRWYPFAFTPSTVRVRWYKATYSHLGY